MPGSPAPVPPSWLHDAVPEPVHEAVELRGSLPVDRGAEAPTMGQAWLVRAGLAAWVVARDGEAHRAVPLDRLELRYEARLLGDLLHVGPYALGVPRGEADRVQALLGLARLSTGRGHPVQPPGTLRPPWGAAIDGLAAAWVAAEVQPDELLLAWLPTLTDAPLVDPWLPGQVFPWAWLVTDRRSLLVAVSPLGAAASAPLPDDAVLVDGSGRASAGDQRWRVDRSLLADARRIAALAQLGRAARRREAARRLTVDGQPAHALCLLEGLPPHPLDPLCRAVAEGVRPPLDEGLRGAIDALPTSGVSGSELAMWAEAWSAPAELATAVMQRLRAVDPAYALPLHELLHLLAAAARKGGPTDPIADLELAQHHLEAGLPGEVESLLAGHAERLPPDDPAHDLPPDAPDPVTGEGGVPGAGALLDALARARHQRGVPVADLRRRIAARQPLAEGHLRALVEAAKGPLAARAERAMQALEGHPADPTAASARPVRPLSPDRAELLRHPVSRQGGALARLPGALARIQPPDAGALRDYCERLDPARHPHAAAAVADAALLLGLAPLPAFVSRGQRSVGLRAHERPEPFLVIGGDHLDPDSGYHLSPGELRFAIGAELGHLRFGHRRVGAEDLWAGLWDKGALALTAASSLLPLVEALKLGGRALRYGAAGVTALGALRDASGRLGLSPEAPAGPVAADMGVDPDRLLGVARVLQLTADRAGLVLSGDPVASTRAMFKVHTRLRPELDLVDRVGLRAALLRLDPAGRPLLPHLALRVSALLSFWLDPELQDLVDEATRAG